MKTLVILVSRELHVGGEPNKLHPHDADTAVRLYGDLIEKTGANRILALRTDSTDSMPVGIAELERNKDWGLEESHCVSIDDIDIASWTGDEDPDEFWSGALETTILNSGISSTGGEWCFMVNSGAAWSAFQLYALYEILGGSIWVTTEKGEKYTATEFSRKIPDEGSPGEAALAGIADFGIENPGSVPGTTDLQGLVEGGPTGQGFENSLRGYEEYFEDERVSREEDLRQAELAYEEVNEDLENLLIGGDKEETKEASRQKKMHERRIRDKQSALNDPKGYLLNPKGRHNANLALARKWSSRGRVKGGKTGIVIFVRGVRYPEWLVDYLKEHMPYFDKFAFVVGGIDITDMEELSNNIHEAARQHLGPEHVVSSPEDVCFNIATGQDAFEYSAEVTGILHSILKSNEGVEWSLEISQPMAMLRGAVYQFAHLAQIPLTCITKEQRGDSGIHESGLTREMHKLRVPDNSDVNRIRGSISHKGTSRLIATAYKSYLMDPNTILDISKADGECPFYDRNKDQFPTDHPLRYNPSPKADTQHHAVRRGFLTAIDLGSITKMGTNKFVLNSGGIVAGALLVNRG